LKKIKRDKKCLSLYICSYIIITIIIIFITTRYYFSVIIIIVVIIVKHTFYIYLLGNHISINYTFYLFCCSFYFYIYV